MSGPLYDRQWRKRRARQLAESPLCRLHLEIRGEVVAATIADHIEPHRDDPVLFAGPLQSLCKECHDSWKQAIEKGGHMAGSDLNGYPLDPSHPWNTAGGRSKPHATPSVDRACRLAQSRVYFEGKK